MKLAIVVANFYPAIAEALLDGALGLLEKEGIPKKSVLVFNVPGTYEIPLAVKKLADGKKYDGVIALGCLIRGATLHFDVIAHATLTHLQQISLQTGIPVTAGILMLENEAQALERLGGKKGHRGAEAARAALEMVRALKEF